MEFDRQPDCFTTGPDDAALPIYAVRPDGLADLLPRLAPAQAAYVTGCSFQGSAAQIVLLPGEQGLAGALLGLGEADGPHVFGALPTALPGDRTWRFAPGLADPAAGVLGWGLGAYRFDQLRSAPGPARPRLILPNCDGLDEALSGVRATWLARDLINTPANLLGPAELAQVARNTLTQIGVEADLVTGAALSTRYPVLHAVGEGSARPPWVALGTWRHPEAAPDAPLLSICGKGVCFDSGGYDLKPPAGMLRMKKDMAGAAVALGLARMIVEARLPVRLEIRLGCVENMVSAAAMRPLDILKTRSGVSIEVGNTDAEGRLVLCELLAEADAARPAALLDFATLTGAARVALGPDLPALFSSDDVLAESLLSAGRAVHDPCWRLPLWNGYSNWLESSVADLNNVSDKPHAGAIVAALFLHRFVCSSTAWAHVDLYGWNETSRPGRPTGGEAQALRAAFEGLKHFVAVRPVEQ